MDVKLIVKRIREICDKQNLEIPQLEIRLGVSRGLIGRWEKGNSKPSSETLINISNILNVSMDYLLGKSDIMGTSEQIVKDEDVLTIQRAKENMSTSDSEKMMKLLKITFAEYFPDNKGDK